MSNEANLTSASEVGGNAGNLLIDTGMASSAQNKRFACWVIRRQSRQFQIALGEVFQVFKLVVPQDYWTNKDKQRAL